LDNAPGLPIGQVGAVFAWPLPKHVLSKNRAKGGTGANVQILRDTLPLTKVLGFIYNPDDVGIPFLIY